MKTRFLSKEEQQQALVMYNQGFNTVQIAKTLQRSSSAIQRLLKKEGYKKLKPRRIHWTPEEIQLIVKRYKTGETAQQIAYDYLDKVSGEATIRKLLKRNGVQMRRVGCASKVSNHRYFEFIDTPEKAYWLGMILADGCIHKKEHAISLELHKDDKYLIEQFKKAVGADTATTKSRNCFRTQFTSRNMVANLEKYGVVPNKSKKTTFLPVLSENLMPHLIRGIFDGDGTAYINKEGSVTFGFYGSSRLCNEIRDYLCDKIGLANRKVFDKETVSFVYFSRKPDIKAFYNFIYRKSIIYMTRKKDIFDNYFMLIPR